MGEIYPVIAGAETFYFEGNDVGILISHGFMGTPQSVVYVGKRLAQLGYTVLAPRLKGHGTHYHDLENCTKEDWFHSMEKAHNVLKRRCSTIFVMGQSMGGTLALHLAHKFQSIQGIMLINAALTIPTLEYVKGSTEPRFIDEGTPDIKAKNVHEITYQKTPLTAIHELQNLMESTPAILSNIKTPILGIKSTIDHVCPPENTEYILEKIGATKKEIITLTNSYHVATMDNDKETIVEACHQFVKQQEKENCFLLKGLGKTIKINNNA